MSDLPPVSPASPATVPGTPTTVLREETAPHHRRAERTEFQRALLAGRLPLNSYRAWLGQMLVVYEALEEHLEALRARGKFVRLLALEWARTAELERDLAELRAGQEPPCPATLAFQSRLAAWAKGSPEALLGVLYVLEGSTNGSRHIARAIRSAYGLEGSRGTAFLDPYGDRQPDCWRAFKEALDAEVPSELVCGLVEAAGETFDAVTAIATALWERENPPPVA